MKKVFTIFSVIMLSLSAFAELGYGVALTQNDFNSTSTVVKKEGTIEWDTDHVRCGGASNGISIGGPSWNWDDKYFDVKLANGVPEQLSFEWACNNITSTDPEWYVKESANGTNWTTVWENNSSSVSWAAVTKNLKPGTRYLRFCFSGNFAGNFRKIKVTEKIEMGTPSVESLDFGTVKVDTDTTMSFTISWTNLEAAVTSSDAHFTVDPATIGEIGANAQTSTVAVSLVTNEAGTYSGTVTVEGRGKSAQLAVSGSVEKYDQTITWEPAESYNFGETVPVAVASSALDVEYEIANPEVLKFENGAFVTLYAGTTQITAKQAGNYKFNAAANVVRTITVIAPTTYGDFAQTTCDEPVEYNGKTYSETTKEDVNVGLNYMGGDSIVHVNIVINHATTGEESITIVYGEDKTWNGIALKDSTVGVHTVVYTTMNIAGCDSTVTLSLTVNKQETVEVPVDLAICIGDTVEYRGVEYTKEGTYNVSAEGTVRDTLYIVKVKENPVYSFSETGTAKVGEGYTWHETTYETPATGTFNYELPFSSIYGCDSIYHLTLTVTKADREEIPVELVFCEGDSAEYRGVVYTKAGQYPVYAEGAVRDTIYNVQVAVNQPSETFDEMTIVYGEDKTWNGIALKDSTVGVHTVVYTTTNIAGCDSVVTLALTVQKMDVLTLEQTLEFCEGDTVAYRDVAYYEAGVDTIEISGEVRDTMIVVTVTVWEKTYAEILVTDTVGNTIELPEGEWLLGEEVVSGTYELQEADTMGLEFVQYGETSHGCEAVTKLIVTVEERPMSEGIEDVFVEQAAKKFFRNGAIYIRRQDMLFGIDGKRVE